MQQRFTIRVAETTLARATPRHAATIHQPNRCFPRNHPQHRYDAKYTDDTALPPAPPVFIHRGINTKTPIVKLAWTCDPTNM
jgi:hypothetical protein